MTKNDIDIVLSNADTFGIPKEKLTSKHFKEIMAYLELFDNMVDIDKIAAYNELLANMESIKEELNGNTGI